MPFRILITLIVLGLLAASVLILPLVWPVPPLEGTRSVHDLAADDADWIDAGSVQLHARVAGPAGAESPEEVPAAMAFVHGFGSTLASFDAVRSVWAESRSTVAYDRPGFGLSERPLDPPEPNPYAPEAQVDQLFAVLDRLGPEPAVVVGHSAGGAIALEAALRDPDRFEALVLIAPVLAGGGGPPGWAAPLLRTPHARRIGPALMRQLGGERGENLLRSAYADPERIRPEVLDAHRTAAQAHDWDRALWEVVRAAENVSFEGRWERVRVPVLIIVGDADPIVPPEASEGPAAAVPLAERVVLDGCGHVVQEECPERLVATVDAWEERRSAERSGADAP